MHAEQLRMPNPAFCSLQVAKLHNTMPALDFGLLWRRVQEWGGYQQVRGRLPIELTDNMPPGKHPATICTFQAAAYWLVASGQHPSACCTHAQIL